MAAASPTYPERQVRLAYCDLFREKKILRNLIPLIENVLAAGDIKPPEMPPESVPHAIPPATAIIGEEGHRNK